MGTMQTMLTVCAISAITAMHNISDVRNIPDIRDKYDAHHDAENEWGTCVSHDACKEAFRHERALACK